MKRKIRKINIQRERYQASWYERKLVDEGKTIAAVKHYKKRILGSGLKEAKEAIERYKAIAQWK